MNCRNWEEKIALYTGGDLTAEEAADVERHLAECAGCQVFASGMSESLALLREEHAEEIGGAAYVAVRARVLGEIERRPSRWWMFGLAAAFTAAALLAAVWLRPVKHVEIARHEALARFVSPVRPATVEPPVVRVARAHRHRKSIPAAAPVIRAAAPEEKPLVVKMVTDDPGVVIYWISDTRGEPK